MRRPGESLGCRGEASIIGFIGGLTYRSRRIPIGARDTDGVGVVSQVVGVDVARQ
jgi:hypothetical protein